MLQDISEEEPHARSNLKNSNISLAEDLPVEIAIQRRALYPIMKAANKLPETKAFTTGNKLVINGKPYTTETLKYLPPNLDPAKIATKRVGNVTAFFTASSPLSNFFPLDNLLLMVCALLMLIVEQYFQWSKAMFAENPEAARKIRGSTLPAYCKRLGDDVKVNDQEWLPRAKDVMLKACQIKFTTDTGARQFLLTTHGTVLVEAGEEPHSAMENTLQDIPVEPHKTPVEPHKTPMGPQRDVPSEFKRESHSSEATLT